MLISTAMFSQIAGNFDLGIRSDFDDLNSIGVSGTYLYDVDGKLGVGANVGLRFPTASGISGIHIPVLGDVRYYLQGNKLVGILKYLLDLCIIDINISYLIKAIPQCN